MKTPRKRVPWSHGDRLLMIVLGLLAAGVSLGVWSRGQDQTPDVIVPNPILPNPNALDYYVKAGAAITGANVISPPTPHPPLAPTAAQAAVVRQNAGAIGVLHQGFTYPCHGPVVRSLSSDVFPQYRKLIGLAQLLALQGRVDAAQGDWSGAMTADLDCLRMGEDIPRGSGLNGMLIGAACASLGRRHAWEAVDRLTAAQARTAAVRLEGIRAQHVPFADTAQEEEWTNQAGLLERMRQPGWPGAMAENTSNAGSPSPGAILSNWKTAAVIHATGKRTIMEKCTRYVDQIIANARQPYAAHPPEPVPPAQPIGQMMLSTYELGNNLRIYETKADTENALLVTMLALRAYKMEHGAYPAALSALVPSDLKAVPNDPFALSGPLLYKRRAGGFLLYSVGPDGRDDGGEPIFDAKSTPTVPGASDQRCVTNLYSQGDIVAGVNVN